MSALVMQQASTTYLLVDPGPASLHQEGNSMKFYRGQGYGSPVGDWWTVDIEYARSHVRAVHQSWVILSFEATLEELVNKGAVRSLSDDRTIFRFDLVALRRIVLAVNVIDGFIPVERY